MSNLFKSKQYSFDTHSWEEIDHIIDENWKRLQEHDNTVKKEGKLVGRYIQESVADGYAIYQIIKENKKTVRIKRIPYVCGDEYEVSYWGGDEATIEKDYAVQSIRGRDFWDERTKKR